MFRTFVLFLSLVFLTHCGYFDNDGTKYHKVIAGKFGLAQQYNSDGNDLVLQDSETSFEVIENDCSLVYYDSTRRRIFVQRELSSTISAYYSIHLPDSGAPPARPYEKHELEQAIFQKAVMREGVVKIDLP